MLNTLLHPLLAFARWQRKRQRQIDREILFPAIRRSASTYGKAEEAIITYAVKPLPSGGGYKALALSSEPFPVRLCRISSMSGHRR